MPFPPEYLAPPAERLKRERKTKMTKYKKETSGKVRESEELQTSCLGNVHP